MNLKESIYLTLKWISEIREKEMERASNYFYARDYENEQKSLDIIERCDKINERLMGVLDGCQKR